MKIKIKEIGNTPQVIFLAGPAGAGKSFISKSLPLSKFQVINVDDTYEELLKASGMGMKQKDFDPEQLSQAAKLMGQAQKTTKEKYAKALENLNDIIIDGTGAASRPLLKKKAELEALGYETMMVMIFTKVLMMRMPYTLQLLHLMLIHFVVSLCVVRSGLRPSHPWM